MPQDRRRNNRGNESVEEKQFDERVVHIDRVARVVKGGRRFRFRALVVIGDHKGRVGVGVSKGDDVTSAVTKATDRAKKTMLQINLYKGTLPHEVQAKVGGADILIKQAAPGTGLIAGGVVRIILEVVGVQNALSKSIGSSNKINIAYASLEALSQLKLSKDWVTNMTSDNTSQKSASESIKKTTTAVKKVA